MRSPMVGCGLAVAFSLVGIVARSQTPKASAALEASRERYPEAIVHFQQAVPAPTAAPAEPRPSPVWQWGDIERLDARAHPFLVKTYASSPWRLFYNLGQIFLQVGEPAPAAVAFERYLALGGDLTPEARRAEVEQRLAELRPQLGSIEISVSPTDSDVTVAGFRMRDAPTDATLVAPGRYSIEARHEGMVSQTVSVVVEAGRAVRVPLILVREPTGADARAPSAATAARVEPRRGCACATPVEGEPGLERSALVGALLVCGALARRRRRRWSYGVTRADASAASRSAPSTRRLPSTS